MPQSRRRKPKNRSGSAKRSAAKHRSNKTVKIIAFVIIAALIIAGIIYIFNSSGKPAATSGNAEVSLPEFDNATTTASGLKYIDVVEGTGETPKAGQTVTVHYTGQLTNGTKFDSSRDRGQPSDFRIGVGKVIKAWDETLLTMKVGGRRKLLVPPNLGYGASGFGSSIPPNAPLVFDIELLGVK